MSSATERAELVLRLIDAALEEVASETAPLLYPEEAKPVGPYETFGQCVAGIMRRQDVSRAAAERICGSMEGRRAKSRRSDQRYLTRVLRAMRPIAAKFEADLRRAFLKLGDEVARAYRAGKQGSPDLEIELLIREADVAGFSRRELARPFERLYQLTGEVIYQAVSERVGIDVAWNLADPVAREVVATGGRRLGLIDFTDDTRSSLFRALHEGRSEGVGAIDLARRIRELVPAGRFTALEDDAPGRGVAYRSELITRTETTYARNVSAIGAGAHAGFEQYMVFDARLGPTDETCELMDGRIVSAPEAMALVDQEHPNGTRSVSPMPRS